MKEKPQTLLEMAKSIKKKPPKHSNLPEGPDAEDLAIAWLNGEVTTSAIANTLKCYQTSVYVFVALRARDALRSGRLKQV